MIGPWEVLSLAVIVCGLALVVAYLPLRPAFVREWAEAHALALTLENEPLVSWYLRTARRLRTWGAVAGLVLPPLIELAWSGRGRVLGFGTDGAAPGEYFFILVGYLVGALYAEISLVRPVGRVRAAASLIPRELADYLPRRVLLAQRGLAAGAAAGALVAIVLPYDDKLHTPSALALAVTAAVCVLFAAVLEAGERWLVRRPQPFSSPSLVAADDAIRSQSVHAVAGSGLALLLWACSGVSLGLMLADVAALRWTMWLPATAAFLASLVVCQHWSHRPWRVRRPLPGARAGPTAPTAPTAPPASA
jgi:hypothetical protein